MKKNNLTDLTLAYELAQQQIPKYGSKPKILSIVQQRLLLQQQLDAGANINQKPLLFKVIQTLDLERMQLAIEQVSARHSVLNTRYFIDSHSGEGMLRYSDAKITVEQCEVADQNGLEQQLEKALVQPFNLAKEPGLRVKLLTESTQQYLLFVFHQIAFDDYAQNLFFTQLSATYEGDLDALNGADISYEDYANWQWQQLQAGTLQSALDYWRDHLSEIEPLRLPTALQRPAQQDLRANNISFTLAEPLSTQLRQLAESRQTSLYCVLLSAYYVTLACLSGQRDIAVITAAVNRNNAQTKKLLGHFSNPLVLRNPLDFGDSVADLLDQVGEVIHQGQVNQGLPFELLLESLALERDPSRHPLAQAMFSLERPIAAQALAALPFARVDLEPQQSNCFTRFDVAMYLCDQGAQITGHLQFAAALYDVEAVEQWLAIYQRILSAMVTDVEQPIDDIDMIGPQMRALMLQQWNRTDAPLPPQQTLYQLFEAAVRQNPEKIALIFEQQSISYADLNGQANRLANSIRQQFEQRGGQVSKDTLIGLYYHRSIEMIVAILAVLKAGAAYVPISPKFPRERTAFILSDTKTPLVLTQQALVSQLQLAAVATDLKILPIESLDLTQQSSDNLSLISGPADLAFVIYTSGTTGQPKGVLVEHRNAVNTIVSMQKVYEIGPDNDKSTCFSQYVFDVSVSEIFGSLCFGGELHLFDDQVYSDIQLIKAYLLDHQIHHLFLSPAGLAMLPQQHYPGLRTITFAGESCDQQRCMYWSENYRLYNYYGPTEATIYASGKLAQAPNLNEIGKPLDNTRLYVLDAARNPVPMGTIGELYIGGAGITRGYLNRESLTSEVFIDNPFADDNDRAKGFTRLYKTGDRVYWTAKGDLAFIGRVDSQVKIRGFRIELAEVEQQLNKLAEVKSSVVVDWLDGNGLKTLVAYIIGQADIDEQQLDEQVRTSLADNLPDYMIPSRLVMVKEFPLTTSGKIDKKALPEPQVRDYAEYVAPTTAMEKQLVALWTDLLKYRGPLSVNGNFFKLGGHSLIALKMAAAIYQQHQRSLNIDELFANPTINKLAKVIEAKISSEEVGEVQRIGAFHQDSEFDMDEFEL